MRDTRFTVITHTWDERHCRPGKATFIGMADDADAAERMAAEHAAAHGTSVDHRHYSISVARYPDPEAMARARVAAYVRLGRSLEDVIKGQGGEASISYESQVGGYVFRPGADIGMKLQPHEMYCRVGDDSRVFDLRVLYAEEISGMRQGALL